jgi:hypothetical protein
MATHTGGAQIAVSQVEVWTVSDDAVQSVDGRLFSNNSASNLTKTIPAGLSVNFSIGLQQTSTGTCTFAAGAGVTFIGATLATAAAGDTIVAIPTGIADTYNVKKA